MEEALLMTTAIKKNGVVRDRYLDLIRAFPLRPIRSDRELGAALAVIDRLLDQRRLLREERDYLDVLSALVEQYETQRHPMPRVSDAEMLRHLIEAKGVAQVQVARATGIAESTISAVLAGHRRLGRNHIEKLARYFHVGPEAFMPL
jgi:HTH-type transcriptional regulator / antitoxin HigA